MEAALLFPRGGVRSLGKFKLVDGNAHELFFLSRTTAETIAYKAGLFAFKDLTSEPLKLMNAMHKHRTDFIASALCDEAGAVLLTPEQALRLDFDLAKKLSDAILSIDSELGEADAGKG